MNIADSQIQMTLDLDTGLTDRFRSVKEVVAAGVYRLGLKRCAGDLDVAPGNLSVYIEVTGDRSPIYYLVARYCGDQGAARDEALERVQSLLNELPSLLASAGVNKRRAR